MKLIFKVQLLVLSACLLFSCKKNEPIGPPSNHYPADVAVAWMKLQMRLNKTTKNYNNSVSGRSFAYSGITLYESIKPGIPNGQSLVTQLVGFNASSLPLVTNKFYYWPASANAAMALITKDLFANTSPANFNTIDSLEASFNEQFKWYTTPLELQNSISFGTAVADAIYKWSKDDGEDEPYLHIFDPTYIPPAGPGLWIPTPPLFSKCVYPHWGNKRCFVENVVSATQPGPPLAYSKDPTSEFYNMVNELYTKSLSLTHEDSTIAKFWGDIPGNYNVPSHYVNIVNQLIVLNNLDLADAAIAYAKHGIATNDAVISVFATKYIYNLIRPISYIRNEMNHPAWNTVIPTPAHPEYSAAHAVVSSASARVLEDIFGSNYSFTDHTYDALYGPRSYNTFDDYAKEAGHSRFLAGIHYNPSIAIGLIQGRKVGDMVLSALHFSTHKTINK